MEICQRERKYAFYFKKRDGFIPKRYEIMILFLVQALDGHARLEKDHQCSISIGKHPFCNSEKEGVGTGVGSQSPGVSLAFALWFFIHFELVHTMVCVATGLALMA